MSPKDLTLAGGAPIQDDASQGWQVDASCCREATFSLGGPSTGSLWHGGWILPEQASQDIAGGFFTSEPPGKPLISGGRK